MDRLDGDAYAQRCAMCSRPRADRRLCLRCHPSIRLRCFHSSSSFLQSETEQGSEDEALAVADQLSQSIALNFLASELASFLAFFWDCH